MADAGFAQTTSWSDRGAHWARTAPQGKSEKDGLNQTMIELAGIGEGDRVLDIATGAGEPAISIALKVGPGGEVTCRDANPEMLQGARNRAAHLGLENVRFEIGDMEKLPFDDHRFDAVTCRFGLMFPDDPVAALTEARRVLKPGAKAVYVVHGPAAENTLYTVMWRTIRAYFDEPGLGNDSRRQRYGGEGELTALFLAAGFEDVGERPITEADRRPARGRFWDTMFQRAMGARLEVVGEADLAALHDAIRAAFAPYLKGDHYELSSAERAGWGSA